MATSVCIFRSVCKEHEKLRRPEFQCQLCHLPATWPWINYVTPWASASSVSNGHTLCLSHRAWGKECHWKCFANYEALVNTYSVNKYLLRAYYVPGIVPLQLLSSLPTLHLFSSITGYQFQMQLVYGLKPPTRSPSFVPNEASVTCLHQETLDDISAVGHVSTNDDGDKGFLPPLLPQRAWTWEASRTLLSITTE